MWPLALKLTGHYGDETISGHELQKVIILWENSVTSRKSLRLAMASVDVKKRKKVSIGLIILPALTPYKYNIVKLTYQLKVV